MARPGIFTMNGVGDQLESSNAFVRLRNAIMEPAPKPPEPADANLNFKDVRNTLPIIAVLQAISGQSGGVEALLGTAGQRKAQSANQENQRRQGIFQSEREAYGRNIEVAKLGYEQAEDIRKEGIANRRHAAEQSFKERQFAEGLEEKGLNRLRMQADGLSRQYGGAKKAGDIRRLGKALQDFGDANPDFAAYAPTDEQIEADVEALKDVQRSKAGEAWSKALDRVGKTYGYINPEDAKKLEITRQAIAKQNDIEDPDELMPIITAKSVGMQKLEETVRANQAKEGETNRHNLALEGAAKDRIEIQAGNLAVAQGRLAVAQQNANTYRAVAEGKGAIQTAQQVWGTAQSELQKLAPKIAGYEAIKNPNQQQISELEKLKAQRAYWSGLKEQATMTAEEARQVSGWMNKTLSEVGVQTLPQNQLPRGTIGMGGVQLRPSTPAAVKPKTKPKSSGGSSIWTPR